MTEPTAEVVAADKTKKRWPRIVMIVVAVLVAVVLVIVGAVALFGKSVADDYTKNVTTIEEVFPDESTRPAASVDGAQTFLLLGSDTRADVDLSTTDGAQDGRSDTMMVVRIPADRSNIYVMSLMRDSWVDIPGYGEQKINAAMAYGGVPLAVQTVEGLLGTRIDHVAMIDFEGFKGVTDALGGVTINNPISFESKAIEKTYVFPEGEINLNGAEALAFVRERMSFVDSDYQRVKNQQLYIKSMMAKLISKETLTSPTKLSGVISSISPFLSVDKDLSAGYLLGLLPGMINVRASDVVFFTAPTNGTGTSDDGQSIVVLDQERFADLAPAFQNDTLADYLETHDLAATK